MSSRFVSGGTVDEPVERDDEWLKAQRELEQLRRRKEEEGRQGSGQSLFDTLQANKVAKQEAFEESIKLKNQFRSLDEDEVDFLDSVLESTRRKEAAIKKETAEQLKVFRKEREEADKATANADDAVDSGKMVMGTISPVEEDQWAISGRKRKKGKQDSLKPIKSRKLSGEELPVSKSLGRSNSGGKSLMESSPNRSSSGSGVIRIAVEALPPSSANLPDKPPLDLKSSQRFGLLGLEEYSSDES